MMTDKKLIRNSINNSINSSNRIRLPLLLPVFIAVCIAFHLFFVSIYLHRDDNNSDHKLMTRTVPSISQKQKEQQQTRDPIVVAHVISLIKCKKQASVTGFLDAAAILRHSIHLNSVHNNHKSKYSYKMYAIVHESCQSNIQILKSLGYISIVRPSPIRLDDISTGWYKDHVENENCCGSAEFVKLYAYTLVNHPITVHWDIDVAVYQPLDDLFDSMIYPASSPQGRIARSNIERQHPHKPLPGRIDAFFTRDITSAQPWEVRQGVQGGFLVSRPSLDVFETYMKFIKAGNYTPGRGNGKGWAGLGYGGFQGAMAYQGVVAYYYDQLAPNSAVELDVCIWNQVVADVIWRGPTAMEHYGQCREYPTRPGDSYKDNTPENGRCTDCRIVPVDKVKTAHYTACRKPWECTLPYPRTPRDMKQKHRLENLTNITTCGLLFRKYFELRSDFEQRLLLHGHIEPSATNDNNKMEGYEPQYFGGYCRSKGSYIPMTPIPEDFDITKIYGM